MANRQRQSRIIMTIKTIVASIAGAALINCGAAQASNIAPTTCPAGYEPVDSEELINYGASLGLSALTTRQDRFEPFMIEEFIDALSGFPEVVVNSLSGDTYSTFDLIANRAPGRLNFGSTDRKNATNALYQSVEPGGIGRVFAWANGVIDASYGYRAGPALQSFSSDLYLESATPDIAKKLGVELKAGNLPGENS